MNFASQDFLYFIFIVAYFVFALYKLRLAVLALPLFFPAYLLSFKLAGIPFTLIEALIYVTFLALCLNLIMNKFFVHKNIARDKIWLPIGLLFLAAVISTLIVPKEMLLIDGKTIFASQKIALGILKGWIVLPIIAFALFYVVPRKPKDLQVLLDFYVISGLFLALWGIYQVVSSNYITPDMRASGPFISANYLALYITPAVFYAFARLIHVRNFIFGLIFVVLGVALLFTKSYAAIMTLFVAVFGYSCLWHFQSAPHGSLGKIKVPLWKFFLYFVMFPIIVFVFLINQDPIFDPFEWISRKTKKTLWKLVPFCVMFWVAVFALLASFNPIKWQQFFQFTARTSSAVRLEVYQIALKLTGENPFLGLGLGQFPVFYQLNAPRILGHAPYEWNMLHPHNLFLAFWLNLGIIGLAAFIWILVLCVRKVWSLMKTFPKQAIDSSAWIKVVAFFMLFIILFHGFFDTPFFKNDLALLFWLIVGVILLPVPKKFD